MRDKNRISKIMSRIQRLWEKYPDLRLTQLIENVYDHDCIYHIEDEAFVEKMEKFYNRSVEK